VCDIYHFGKGRGSEVDSTKIRSSGRRVTNADLCWVLHVTDSDLLYRVSHSLPNPAFL